MRVFTIILSGLILTSCSNYKEKPKVNKIDARTGAVTAPKCPDWRKPSHHTNYYNTDSSNFKCATITNFGAMIEDPEDMLYGKSRDTNQGQRSTNPIAAYRLDGVPGQ